MIGNISFRTQLIGSITDFAESCSMGLLLRPSILAELIGALSKYREEGIKLSPEVYLCNDIAQLLKLIPDSSLITIGRGNISEEDIREILKKCAPLARDEWCIYIEGKNNNMEYGLFRGPMNPLAVPIETTLLEPGNSEVKVVKVHQIADDCVEIKNYRGDFHNIFFSHKKDSIPSPLKYLDDLVRSICENITITVKDSAMTFLNRVIRESLLASLGSLVVVCQKEKVPKYLTDGVILSQPIDFLRQIEDALKVPSQLSILKSETSLIKGMFSCDGIVVFNKDAKLLAYNCFISLSPKKVKPAEGGARRRAFDSLCNRLGQGIYAAFIQSQDGQTDFRKVKK